MLRRWQGGPNGGRPLRLLAPLLLLAVAAPAQAATLIFSAPLLGSNEVPPSGSPGSGTATVVVDDVALTIRFFGNFSGLTSNTTMAHVLSPRRA